MTYQDQREFNWLLHQFQELSPRRRIIEIGSLSGETLRYWIDYAEPGSRVVSIDVLVPRSDPRWQEQWFGHRVLWPQWASARGSTLYAFEEDSRDPACVQAVKTVIPEADFLFIDGGHEYENAINDFRNYGPLVRKGGLMAFHDITQEWPGVRRAWDEVRAAYRHEERILTPNKFGLGILYV